MAMTIRLNGTARELLKLLYQAVVTLGVVVVVLWQVGAPAAERFILDTVDMNINKRITAIEDAIGALRTIQNVNNISAASSNERIRALESILQDLRKEQELDTSEIIRLLHGLQ